jgi:hypothetical protein
MCVLPELSSILLFDGGKMQTVDVKRTGANIPLNVSGIASSSRGLVGDTVFAILPNVQPIHTFMITIAFQAVCQFRMHLILTEWNITDLLSQTVVYSVIQILPDGPNAMWLYVFHVWLACPREGYFTGACSVQVIYTYIVPRPARH